MAVVFAIFATVAFVLTTVQAGLSLLRWIREPTFEVLWASFATERNGEGPSIVKGGVVTVVAYGGARTRNVVNWKCTLFRPTGDGRRVGIGTGPVVAPTLETIPAHESTKFTLRVESGMALEEGIPERLTGELHLRLDKYWTCVEFGLHRVSTGDFYLDTRFADEFPRIRTGPWWRRLVSRIQRLF